MIGGIFEIWENLPDGTKEKVVESHNRLTYDGQEFILDFAFGRQSWFSGAIGYNGSLPASGAWNPDRYVCLGYSADDNDGWLAANNFALTGAAGGGDNMTGGTGISGDVVTTGANIIHFPNVSDNYMTSMYHGGVVPTNKNVGTGLFYKLADKIERSGRTVVISATFNTVDDRANGDADSIPTGTKLRELAICLGVPTGIVNPSTVVADRPAAIIAKSTRYEVSGGYIQDNPVTAGANSFTVTYTIGDSS